jgi:hypothetical protein
VVTCASAEARRRATGSKLGARARLVPYKVRPTLAICQWAPIVWVTAAQVAVPGATVVGAVPAVAVDVAAVPELGDAGRPPLFGSAAAVVDRCATVVAGAVIGGEAVIARHDMVAVAALADGSSLGRICRCGCGVVCRRSRGTWRRDRCVRFGECTTGCAFPREL